MISTASDQANEINRLHGSVVQLTDTSRSNLCMAVEAAWHAGKLLLSEQERVRRQMGGAWTLWVESHFEGSLRTAQNYMRLAESIDDISHLEGLGLREIYLKLGIATEPKSRGKVIAVPELPTHVRLVNRLLVSLEPCFSRDDSSLEKQNQFKEDLRPLYERLRPLFETQSTNLLAK